MQFYALKDTEQIFLETRFFICSITEFLENNPMIAKTTVYVSIVAAWRYIPCTPQIILSFQSDNGFNYNRELLLPWFA